MADLSIKTYNSKLHNIYLTGCVDEEMWLDLVHKINEMKASDNDVIYSNVAILSSIGLTVDAVLPEVNIYLSTFGGYLYDMFAIYDEIKELTNDYTVNIYCCGKVMSAGTIIMLATDYKHRFAYRNTTFMFHTLSSLTYGKIKDMEEDTDECKRLHKVMYKIYQENTSIPKSQLDKIYESKVDWYISAEQAKKYKIISKVVGPQKK